MEKFAKVIVDISQEQLDKTFQYLIPAALEEKIVPGVAVEVPFGTNRRLRGFVLEVTDEPEFDPSRTKAILRLEEEQVQVEGRLIELAVWMKENFGGTLNQALKTVLPIKKKMAHKEKKAVRLAIPAQAAKELLEKERQKRNSARERLLGALIEDEYVEYGLLTAKLNISPQTIRAFEQKGILAVERTMYYRNPVKQRERKALPFSFNEEQQNVLRCFAKEYGRGERRTYLLHGVTGSGKTEVYMEMIARVLEEGKQAIVLIPEIALTYQTVTRFCRKFGDRVSIMNSRLSGGERYDQFVRALKGEVDIMIGPRSALFAPFSKLGLIIIDEEHEGAYKSETVPRYHARMVAQRLAQMCGAALVLGSATPSVESYYRAQKGEYRLLEMSHRAAGNALPTVYVEDLREELKAGNRCVLSRRLQAMIAQRLEHNQQVMLFLNKRGYAGFVSCRSCGTVLKCPHCDLSLTYHSRGKSKGRLVCHLCGHEAPMAACCPECGSRYISGFKVGTQQIEEMVGKMYPRAAILRMDADTTAGRDGHEGILAAFAAREADILIGTQMIVKGHDFPGVTLVGILAADMSLYANDYLAAEKTFQLLTQAAGRAGRGSDSGEVVIQTYTPGHYSIQTAREQDYKGFYRQEIAYRKLSRVPPAGNVLLVRFSSANESALEKAVALIQPNRPGLSIIGPADAVIYKANDIYHKVFYIKSDEYSPLTVFAAELETYVRETAAFRNVSLQFDFNPMNMM